MGSPGNSIRNRAAICCGDHHSASKLVTWAASSGRASSTWAAGPAPGRAYQMITSEGATIASTVTYLLPVVAIVLAGIALVLPGVTLTLYRAKATSDDADT